MSSHRKAGQAESPGDAGCEYLAGRWLGSLHACAVPWILGSEPGMCHPVSAWSRAGPCPVPALTVFYYTAFVAPSFMGSAAADEASYSVLNL